MEGKKILLTRKDLKVIEDSSKDDGSFLDAKKFQMEKKLEDEELEIYKKKVNINQDIGFRAIQKEFNIEKLIKKEEQDKEQEELDQIRKKIDQEKKKALCLKKQVEDRDLDNFEVDKREIIRDAENAKLKFNRKVELTRMKLRVQLENMRKKQIIKRQELEEQLKEVRAEMTKNLLRSHRMGDIKHCITGLGSVDYRDEYCNKNFVDDYLKNKDCKEEKEFCYTCCEVEFGNFFMQKRYECYDICDKEEIKKNLNPDDPNLNNAEGKWQWAPSITVVDKESS